MKMNKEVVMVKLSDIIPNRFQPRLTFDEEALNELANSIKEHGILQPLILRDLGSKYEIIAGERRYKASTIAGLTEVPAIVGTMDDQTSAELALIENIQRKDLTAIEEAKSYKKILDMGNFTQEYLAKRMGKSQSTVANKMRLLSLTNEAQMALMNNLISERHARCLLQIKDDTLQKEVLNKIISERLNVRDTDDYIKNILGISKTEMPGLEKEIVPIVHDQVEPVIEELKEENNNEISNLEEVEVPKIEELKEEIKIEVPKDIIEETKKDENPNVYTQSENNDFINISNLDSENVKPSAVKTAISGLNVVSTDSEVFGGKDVLVEEKEVIEMPNIETPEINKKEDGLSKLKLATAIKLAKDTIEEIKKAGYNVSHEEVDGDKEYQIVIKVEK